MSMFSATDIASLLACPHTATLARAESKNEITKPFFKDAAVELLRKLGLEHEQRYLRELAEKDGFAITQIDINGRWENAVADTVRALRKGVDAVYQATFLDGVWGGLIFLCESTRPVSSDRGLTRSWKPSLHAPPRRPHWFSFASIRTCLREFREWSRSGCT